MSDSRHPASGRDRQKPILTPPGTEGSRKKDNRLTVLVLSLGLLFLLGLAAMVIWLLPQSTKLQDEHASQPPTQLQAPAGETAAKQPDPTRAGVEQHLGEWLKLQARAEADNVSVWGADTYPSILEETARADELLRKNYFTEALASYKEVIIRLQELLSSREERLASALTMGALALENHDSSEAAKAFDLALAIDPYNQEAKQGAARARNLDQVIALYNKGLGYEGENDLRAARKTLQEAVALDNKFNPAEEALLRVEGSLRQIAFQEAMSKILLALAENDTAAARLSLAAAASLRPTDTSVRDAGKRLAAMEKAQKLIHLQGKAERMAAEERWSDALHVYDEALAIEPNFGFAEAGRKMARQRFELDRSMVQILSQPARLQEKGPLQEAEHVLAKARSIDNPGPKLQKQSSKLSELVRTASTPVEITLRSDNETSVIIYRVSRFGKFLEKRVTLVPGSYTVVGSRPGFRDVRRTLTVKAADSPIVFEIRCEEPI